METPNRPYDEPAAMPRRNLTGHVCAAHESSECSASRHNPVAQAAAGGSNTQPILAPDPVPAGQKGAPKSSSELPPRTGIAQDIHKAL
jgi:hypothetical protein